MCSKYRKALKRIQGFLFARCLTAQIFLSSYEFIHSKDFDIIILSDLYLYTYQFSNICIAANQSLRLTELSCVVSRKFKALLLSVKSFKLRGV